MQILKKYLWLVGLLFLLSFTATLFWGLYFQKQGEDKVIFSCEDPTGDDYGPGTYVYPLGEAFAPYEGHFDLKSFKIVQDEFNYIFSFEMGELTNQWDAPLGFSHPVLELFIDNFPGGEGEHLFADIPISFPEETKWDRLVRVTGWGIMLYASDREGKNITPVEFCKERVKIKDKVIIFSLPREVIGNLEGAGLWVLVGSWDVVRKSKLRPVFKQTDYWHFGGRQGEWDLPYLDLLNPAYGVQEEQLLGVDSRPVLEPLLIKKKEGILFFIFPGLLILLLLYFSLVRRLACEERIK